MIKIKAKGWRGVNEIDLDQFLGFEIADAGYDTRGAVEEAKQIADQNARTTGRLLAYMVEQGTLPLEKALAFVGCYQDVEVVG